MADIFSLQHRTRGTKWHFLSTWRIDSYELSIRDVVFFVKISFTVLVKDIRNTEDISTAFWWPKFSLYCGTWYVIKRIRYVIPHFSHLDIYLASFFFFHHSSCPSTRQLVFSQWVADCNFCCVCHFEWQFKQAQLGQARYDPRSSLLLVLFPFPRFFRHWYALYLPRLL